MYKFIPIDGEDGAKFCRLNREYRAYNNILERFNTLNLNEDLKKTYSLKFMDIRLRYNIYRQLFNKKYLSNEKNKNLPYRIDLANNLLILREDNNVK